MAYSVQSYRFHSRVINDLTDLTSKHDNLKLTSTGVIYADSTCQNPLDQPISLELSVINDLRVLVPQEITVLDADGYEIYKSNPVLIEDSNIADDGDTSILWDDVQNKPDFPSLYLGIGANAVSATKLVTASTINGTAFDGTANIAINTDAVAEGVTNKYYTDARVKVYGDTVYPQLSIQYTNPTWLAGIDATTIKTGTIDLARLPAMPSANTIVCTTIPAMSAGDQLLVAKGTVVIESTTGNTYRYSGTGSVVLNASYIQQSDLTPDWSVITNRPTNVSTWTNDAGYLTAASSLAWAKLTGVPATFSPSAHTHLWADLTDKPSTFTPSAHTHLWAHITDKPSTFAPSAHVHAIADVTGLQTALDSKQASGDYATNSALTTGLATKQATGAYILLTSPITGYAVGSNAALAATDTVLGAFNKIQAQLNAKQASGAYLTANQTITLSGIVTGSGTTAITTAMADGALTIAKTSGLQTALDGKIVLTSPITGYAVGAGAALAATDTILGAFGKVQAQLNSKQASGNYVTTDNTQTISGTKTFSSSIALSGSNTAFNTVNGNFASVGALGSYFSDVAVNDTILRGAVGTTLRLGVNTGGASTVQITGTGTSFTGTLTRAGNTVWDSGNLTGDQTAHTHAWANITGKSTTVANLIDGSWAGASGYYGWAFTGENTRFGFSSSGGVVDVYADGNFYAGDSGYKVWHAGNLSKSEFQPKENQSLSTGNGVTFAAVALGSAGSNTDKALSLGSTWMQGLNNSLVIRANEIRFGSVTSGWDFNQWAGLKYDGTDIFLGGNKWGNFSSNTNPSLINAFAVVGTKTVVIDSNAASNAVTGKCGLLVGNYAYWGSTAAAALGIAIPSTYTPWAFEIDKEGSGIFGIDSSGNIAKCGNITANGTISEQGTLLSNKYGRLSANNTFTGVNTFSDQAHYASTKGIKFDDTTTGPLEFKKNGDYGNWEWYQSGSLFSYIDKTSSAWWFSGLNAQTAGIANLTISSEVIAPKVRFSGITYIAIGSTTVLPVLSVGQVVMIIGNTGGQTSYKPLTSASQRCIYRLATGAQSSTAAGGNAVNLDMNGSVAFLVGIDASNCQIIC